MEDRIEFGDGHRDQTQVAEDWMGHLRQARNRLQATQQGEDVKANLDRAAIVLRQMEQVMQSWQEDAYDCPQAQKTRHEVLVLQGRIVEARQDVVLAAMFAEDYPHKGPLMARRALRKLPGPQAVASLAPDLTPSERHYRKYHLPREMSRARCRFCGYVVV